MSWSSSSFRSTTPPVPKPGIGHAGLGVERHHPVAGRHVDDAFVAGRRSSTRGRGPTAAGAPRGRARPPPMRCIHSSSPVARVERHDGAPRSGRRVEHAARPSSGVDWKLNSGRGPRLSVLKRHATSSVAKLAALIWSRARTACCPGRRRRFATRRSTRPLDPTRPSSARPRAEPAPKGHDRTCFATSSASVGAWCLYCVATGEVYHARRSGHPPANQRPYSARSARTSRSDRPVTTAPISSAVRRRLRVRPEEPVPRRRERGRRT